MAAPPTTLALRHVAATRYVAPLREGGSLPGLMEADDLGTYVVKFHGAGQGRKVLVAEVVCAALARAVGLRVPELVTVELDPRIGATEPDQEVQDLLRASPGTNLGIDFLPGSLGYQAHLDEPDATTAAAIMWFDGLTQNVDRSWRNPNMLLWHGDLWLIDHGAALYFAHRWQRRANAATAPYPQPREHVLVHAAGSLPGAHERLAPRVTAEVLAAALDAVPEVWLAAEPGFADADAVRAAYVEVLAARLEAYRDWLPAMEAARVDA